MTDASSTETSATGTDDPNTVFEMGVAQGHKDKQVEIDQLRFEMERLYKAQQDEIDKLRYDKGQLCVEITQLEMQLPRFPRRTYSGTFDQFRSEMARRYLAQQDQIDNLRGEKQQLRDELEQLRKDHDAESEVVSNDIAKLEKLLAELEYAILFAPPPAMDKRARQSKQLLGEALTEECLAHQKTQDELARLKETFGVSNTATSSGGNRDANHKKWIRKYPRKLLDHAGSGDDPDENNNTTSRKKIRKSSHKNHDDLIHPGYKKK